MAPGSETFGMMVDESELKFQNQPPNPILQYAQDLQIIMSAKRPAPYSIDEKTLEDKQPQPESSASAVQSKEASRKQQSDVQGSADAPSERKIVSVSKNPEAEKEQVEEVKPKNANLFSNLFNSSPSNGNGLFSGATAQTSASNSIFSNSSSSGSGLFSNKGSSGGPKVGGLFSNSGNPKSESIFNFKDQGTPPVKNTGSSSLFSNLEGPAEEQGDSAELEAAQNIEIDPKERKMKFEYETTSIPVLSQRAYKFKKQGGELIESVDLVVQRDLKSPIFYLSVALPATKKEIFTSVLLEGKSQVRHTNKKSENVEVSVFKVGKDSEVERMVVKLQFSKPEEGEKVHDKISEVISGNFKVEELPQQKVAEDSCKVQKKETEAPEQSEKAVQKTEDTEKAKGEKQA